MVSQELFAGKTDLSICFRTLYAQLLTREWIDYQEVFTLVYRAARGGELSPRWSISNHPNTKQLYVTLKKAVRLCKQLLEEQEPGCWESDGKRKGASFRYLGKADDPLGQLRDLEVIRSVRRYVEFCQDTDGLIPQVWTDHFLSNTRDLLDIRERRTTRVIEADIQTELTNLELLPVLYEAVVQKRVICFDYEDFAGRKFEKIIFHPQYLREFNGRWQLFGETDAFADLQQKPFYNVALDRMRGGISYVESVRYQQAPSDRYSVYFRDIVGVSHFNLIAEKTETPTVYTIRLRALTKQMCGLLRTKPIHDSHIVVEWGDHPDGQYAEFELHAMLNYELLGRILQLGNSIRVVGEERVEDYFRDYLSGWAALYE